MGSVPLPPAQLSPHPRGLVHPQSQGTHSQPPRHLSSSSRDQSEQKGHLEKLMDSRSLPAGQPGRQ